MRRQIFKAMTPVINRLYAETDYEIQHYRQNIDDAIKRDGDTLEDHIKWLDSYRVLISCSGSPTDDKVKKAQNITRMITCLSLLSDLLVAMKSPQGSPTYMSDEQLNRAFKKVVEFDDALHQVENGTLFGQAQHVLTYIIEGLIHLFKSACNTLSLANKNHKMPEFNPPKYTGRLKQSFWQSAPDTYLDFSDNNTYQSLDEKNSPPSFESSLSPKS